MLELFMDLIGYMKSRKKFWIVPLIFIMMFIGGFIFVSQGSAVAPFIYTLF